MAAGGASIAALAFVIGYALHPASPATPEGPTTVNPSSADDEPPPEGAGAAAPSHSDRSKVHERDPRDRPVRSSPDAPRGDRTSEPNRHPERTIPKPGTEPPRPPAAMVDDIG